MAHSFFAARVVCNTPRKKEILERQTTLQSFMGGILNLLRKEPKAHIFLTRVSKKEAPDYYDVIKKPMDLGTIGKKLHLYRSIEDLKADLDLIWNNCLTYNTAEYFINCATEMRHIANSFLRSRDRVFPGTIESIVQEAPPIRNGRGLLGRWIAAKLRSAGLENCEKRVLDILLELLEHKIIREFKKEKREDNNLELSNKQ